MPRLSTDNDGSYGCTFLIIAGVAKTVAYYNTKKKDHFVPGKNARAIGNLILYHLRDINKKILAKLCGLNFQRTLLFLNCIE